jgi:hypothetical protein
MTQSSYSVTSEVLAILATSFTDQGDTLSTLLAGSDVVVEDVLGGMDEAWGPAGSFLEQRSAYLVPATAARASLEVLAGTFRNIGQAIDDLATKYQAAEAGSASGFGQVGQDLAAGGG